MRTCLLLVVYISLAAGLATAQTNDGSAAYLQSECRSVARIENNQIDATDYQKAAWCQGYINGVVDADTVRKKMFFHIPGNVTTGEMVKVVMHFLEEHPEMLHEPSAFVVRIALHKAFGT